MVNNYRHKILKTLEKAYLNNPNNKNRGETIKTIISSLSFNKLKEKTKLSDLNLKRQLTFLILTGDIIQLSNDGFENRDSVNFMITEKGFKSYVSNYYLNENWYRKTAILISLFSPLIALSSLCVTCYNNKNSAQKVMKLENKVELLEKSLLLER